jgi:hypothetical protein
VDRERPGARDHGDRRLDQLAKRCGIVQRDGFDGNGAAHLGRQDFELRAVAPGEDEISACGRQFSGDQAAGVAGRAVDRDPARGGLSLGRPAHRR